MTCEAFERVVTDLACEFLIEAAARKRALAHAQACPRCAARLQQERALTAALNEVASSDTAPAPARVKTALLSAFQQQATPAGVAVPLRSTKEPPRRWSRGVMAAAAVVLLAAVLVALQLFRQQTRVESSTDAGTAIAVASSSPASSAQPAGASQPSRESGAAKREDQTLSAAGTDKQDTPRVTRRARSVFRPVLAHAKARRPSETVTDFVPLTAITDSTAMRSGTIVRVEMPRASLIAMGLPLHAERADEIVKADIVVGDDGLARAIRLVY
ncbi:MAG TPA: hypothetical protein VJZ91_16520 [Blastocatellia bacterium]|nr:hypothetical protein [Blastocatellia bacterium]